MLFSAASSTVYAADTPILKTEVFISETSEFSYPFKEEITEDGNNYKLNKVNYSVLSQEEKNNTVHQTTTVAIDNLYEKIYDSSDITTLADIPIEKQVSVNGKNYNGVLEYITYENMTIQNRTADVHTTLQLTEDKITDSIRYEYNDNEAKETVFVTLLLNNSTATSETKTESVVFPGVFHRYDSRAFIINNKLIQLSEGKSPIDKEYYSDLKADSVYAKASGEITDLHWDGDSYVSDGEVCRNALATLSEERKIYSVTYSNTVDLPDTEGYRAILTYGFDAEKPTGKTEYQVQATAEYLPIEEQNIQPFIIGIGIAILAFLVAVVLAIIAKKKKKRIIQ